MTACPDRINALQALVDGEIDSLNAAAIEDHLRGCAGCCGELENIEALRARLQRQPIRYAVPPGLRDRLERQLAPPAPRPLPVAGRAVPWLGGALMGGVAASLAVLTLFPHPAQDTLTNQLIASHIRSQQLAHITDIAASDRHVVRPWFNGKLDYSPPVPDLSRQGFPLAGGRLDVIGGHSVAAIVYRRRLHLLNLFVRPLPAGQAGGSWKVSKDSYNLVRWTDKGFEFWVISDLGPGELEQFGKAFTSAPDTYR